MPEGVLRRLIEGTPSPRFLETALRAVLDNRALHTCRNTQCRVVTFTGTGGGSRCPGCSTGV